MQRYYSFYIRLLLLAVLALLLAAPLPEAQGEEFPNVCLQEELLEAEGEEHCLYAAAGLKTNAGCRIMPSPLPKERQQTARVASIVARSFRQEAASCCPPADKCRLYCIYRL